LPVRRFNVLQVREPAQTPKARKARHFASYGGAINSDIEKSPFPGFYAFDPDRGISFFAAYCLTIPVIPLFCHVSASLSRARAAFPIYSNLSPVSDPQ
jgi:hypothetical protein